jgi:hypothetical protein
MRPKVREHRSELEADLLAEYRNVHSGRGRWLLFLNPKNRTGQLVLSVLAIAVAIGACEMPTSHEMEMGQQVRIELEPAEGEMEGSLQALGSPVEFGEFLRNIPGVDDVSVDMTAADGAITLDIVAWGQDASPQAITAALRERLPGNRKMRVEVERLSGKVREKLGARIGRRLLNLDISGETAEEIRAEILAQMAAQGFEGDATVDVQVDDNQKTIKIQATVGDGDHVEETEDEIVVEFENTAD